MTGANFNEDITKKYKVSGLLQPSKTFFGPKYRNVMIDLVNAPVEIVDKFVADFPDQKYFLPKEKKETPAPPAPRHSRTSRTTMREEE
jgi:hypothetical protein